jgi:acyl-CoA thioester hydrolase
MNSTHRQDDRVTIPAPFAMHQSVVRPEWIDFNGHMNLAYYVVVFDEATDTLFNALGIGRAYKQATNNGTFAAETHTLYERELLLDDRLRVVTQAVAADARRLHIVHEMFREGEAERAAMQEIMYLHVDLGLRRVAPFPADAAARVQEAVAAHAALPRPAGLGRRIAMPERAAPA